MEAEFEGGDHIEQHDGTSTLIPSQIAYSQAQSSLVDQSSHLHSYNAYGGYSSVPLYATPAPEPQQQQPYKTALLSSTGLHKRGVETAYQQQQQQQQQYQQQQSATQQEPRYHKVMDEVNIKVTRDNALAAYQFYVHPSAKFVNIVSISTLLALLFSFALALWAISIIYWEWTHKLSPFRYTAIIGCLIQIALTLGSICMYGMNNTTFSLSHCAAIASPLIWSNAILITASFILQNFVADHGSVVHPNHPNLYARLIGIMTLFILNFIVTLMLSGEAGFSHAHPEERAPRIAVAVGSNDELLQSSQLIALARRLYRSVRYPNNAQT